MYIIKINITIIYMSNNDKKIINVDLNIIFIQQLIEDINDRLNNKFNKLSVNTSDYILPHKIIQSVQLNKGKLNEKKR